MPAQLTARKIRAIVRRIAVIAQPEQVIMFGSYAKGTATMKSDLDLLVVMPDDAETRLRPWDLQPHLKGSVIPVDVHIVTAEELASYGKEKHHFLHSVLRSGKPVYQAPSMSRSLWKLRWRSPT